jgi:hypothetical protein
MPQWLAAFFLAEGALGALWMTQALGSFGSKLAGLLFLAGSLWYLVQRQRTSEGTVSRGMTAALVAGAICGLLAAVFWL